MFLVFLDRFLHRLRPVAVATLVGLRAARLRPRERALAAEPDVFWGGRRTAAGEPALRVARAARGAIQAVDIRGLIRGREARVAGRGAAARSATSCPRARR